VANQYTVFTTDETFEEGGKEICKMIERRGNIDCLCVCKPNREYIIDLHAANKNYCHALRPFKCNVNYLSCIDICRPEIEVRDNDGKNKKYLNKSSFNFSLRGGVFELNFRKYYF
jgi:hypothetical protein